MSSDRRSRPVNRRRRQTEDDIEQERPSQRRDPRRRTSYVPRQGSGRSSRPAQDEYDESQPERRAPATQRYRPQQPPYRSTRREQAEEYDYLDATYDDDRLISDDRARARPTRRAAEQPAGRTRRKPSRPQQDLYAEEYDDAYGDEYAEEYDDAGYDDSFIDEDDWYEEEAAAGAYRPRQRAARRGAPAIPRPSISISRPNIPRPVVPARVREAAIVQDRGAMLMLGVLVLSAIVMALITMNRVDSLAPGFATHITASGLRDDVRSETALWQLPLMAGALLVMNLVAAWFLATWSAFTARFVLISSLVVQVLIWVALIRLAF